MNLTPVQHARLAAIRNINRKHVVPLNKRRTVVVDSIASGAIIGIEGKTYAIISVSRYQETTWNFRKDEPYQVFEWEMFCLESGETRYLEWERDDEVMMWLSAQKLPNDPGTYGAGSWKEFLAEDKLNDSLTITANGASYVYDDEGSWAGKFYRGNTGNPLYVRFYEFQSTRGCLTVEEWGKNGMDGYEMWLSRQVQPMGVTLLASSQ